MPTGVVSSSVRMVDPPRAEALRGPMLAFRSGLHPFLLGSPTVPRTLCENLFAVGLPNRDATLGAGVAMDGREEGVCSLRTGESGRGREVLGLLPWGLGARPGPTDWLNLDRDGVGGVKLVEFWLPTLRPGPVVGVSGNELAEVGGDSRLTALVRGRKMPAPGADVVK